ncbi:hypothetical protein SAMN05444920_101704 [Nonomuraea solani]|uniref:Excreted virulence factor EspC, type VII ESX diderm n=1 Tax=Nonomuraea solani TaxID=1144553 RepID=A0A1H5UYL3_9ACTN|nr:hypothetical protein [Nonomuraea solani]SEF80242.1 hypothetical protein SAMN05444920_101704 [Nonomuraea solani]
MDEPLIDPATAGDKTMCKPEALRDVAGKLSKDLLPGLTAIRDQTYRLPDGAAGDWDVALGYTGTVSRAHEATRDSLRLVLDQVQRVIDDLVATADTVREADERAAGAAPRNG